jgi:hypothetical protein
MVTEYLKHFERIATARIPLKLLVLDCTQRVIMALSIGSEAVQPTQPFTSGREQIQFPKACVLFGIGAEIHKPGNLKSNRTPSEPSELPW